jgi:sugar lactone lactonase YvrE
MVLTSLASGFCFGAGPRWFEGLVWLSDMYGEAVHTVTMSGESSTLPLPGHRPSGLGFRPDGTLLIVSADRRQVLAYDGDVVTVVADVTPLCPAPLGDLVVDRDGRAYVGSQARSGGVIVRVDPDGHAVVVARELDLPNGMAITPDGATLLVAESTGGRLTQFGLAADGTLSDRAVFADTLAGPPVGICLDGAGGVWTATTLACSFDRVLPGGEVADRIDVGPRHAIACTLGGLEDRTLFLLSSTDLDPKVLRGTRSSRLDATLVDHAAACPA